MHSKSLRADGSCGAIRQPVYFARSQPLAGMSAALKFERTLAKRKLSHGQLSPRGEILPCTAKDCSLWKVIPSGAGWPVEHTAPLTPELQVQITVDPRGQRTFIPLLLSLYYYITMRFILPTACHNLAQNSLPLSHTRLLRQGGYYQATRTERKAMGLLKRVRSC